MTPEIVDAVSARWKEYGLPMELKGEPTMARRGVLLESQANSGGGKIGTIESGGAQIGG